MTDIDSSRRKFLISSAAGISGLVIAQSSLAGTVTNLLDPGSPLMLPENFSPSVWFTMQSSGETTIHVFRQELGQHIGTAFAQIIAEELELDWSKVSIDYPSVDAAIVAQTGVQLTGGSASVLQSFDPLSRAAAVARQFLIDSGADILGSEPSDCYAENSYVVDPIFDQRISYGQILAQTVIDHKIQPEELAEVQLKGPQDYKIIGQPAHALDIEEKVNGKARYGIDARVPNMVFGKVSLAPTRLGSTIEYVNDSAAREEIDGYLETLSVSTYGFPAAGERKTDVALVIAESYPAAMRAEKAISVKWRVPENQLVDSEELHKGAKELAQGDESQVFVKVGDAEKAITDSPNIISAEYRTEMIEHAALEPRSALVQKVDGIYHIYSGCHSGAILIQSVAAELGVPVENVVYHPHLIGGSFGDKIYTDQILAAAKACKQLDRPVKVMLTREDQFNLGHPKTVSYHALTAGIDKDASLSFPKRIKGMIHNFVAGSSFEGDFPGVIYDTVDSKEGTSTPVKYGRGVVSGSDHWYDLENLDIKFFPYKRMNSLVPVGAVRTVGNFFTVFAVESFIDEIAHEIGADPLDLRLSLLKGRGRNAGASPLDETGENILRGIEQVTVGGGNRMANVLKVAAGQASYGSPLMKGNVAQGISVAAAEGRHNPTFAACVADVEQTAGGNIKVNKLTVCADVGIAINPDGLKSQIEGSLLWGISSTFFEETVLEQGRLRETNFDGYQWQRNMDLPELDIHIVENGVHPSGIGENTLALVAPAVCNAIQNLTGKRLRSLPLKHHLPLV